MTATFEPEEASERPLSADVAANIPQPEDDVTDGGIGGNPNWAKVQIVFQGDAVKSREFATGGIVRGPVDEGDDSVPAFLTHSVPAFLTPGEKVYELPEPVPHDILVMHLQGKPIQAIKTYRDRYVKKVPGARVSGRQLPFPVYEMSLGEIKKHIEAMANDLAPWERDLLINGDPAPTQSESEIMDRILPGLDHMPDHMPGNGCCSQQEAPGNGLNVNLQIPDDPNQIAEALKAGLFSHGMLRDKHAVEDDEGPSVYVAGPMRGKPEHNYPTFNAVTENLRRQGFVVKNPAENFNGDQSHQLYEYMELDLQMVMDTEGIVLLPGWRDSELGRIEAAMAKALQHKFYEARLYDETDSSYGIDPFNPDSWYIEEIETPATTDNRGIDGEARSLVYGTRNATYGPPVLDFTVVGRIWAAILSAHLQEHIDDIPPDVVAVLLTGLKLGRQGRTPSHHDSRVDVIGYQLCLDRIVTNDGATPDN